MAGSASNSHRPPSAHEWVFGWRGIKRSYFTMLPAVMLVGMVTAVFLATMRVKVMVPKPLAPRKASLIHLMDDHQGRELAQKAQEGGPFPSSFRPSQWEGMAALESEALAAARPLRPAYQPTLLELPEQRLIQPLRLASEGRPVFPKRVPPELAIPDPDGMQLTPFLYPLSGITAREIPVELPEFKGTIEGEMSRNSWRFLLRLNPQGIVVESVSLEKGGEAGTFELKSWLQRIRFQTDTERTSRWISVAIGFRNQPVDGTQAR